MTTLDQDLAALKALSDGILKKALALQAECAEVIAQAEVVAARMQREDPAQYLIALPALEGLRATVAKINGSLQ